MKQKVGLIISLVVIATGLMFSLQANAETGGGGGNITPVVVGPFPVGTSTSQYFQEITLQPGWNIVSTPRLVEAHQFSASSTSENFSIYILNSSGTWSTMQDIGQTEFTPLFGYFILNKTTSTQTLTLNYKQDVDPAQRLFDRQLTAGWNVIGIANPSYALRQSDASGNGYASQILGSTKDCLSSVIDFTSGNGDKTSVKVSGSWNNRNADDLSSLNDWRDTKAYGVYVNSNCSYHGLQNETSTPGTTPEIGEVTIVKNLEFGDQNIFPNTDISNQKIASFVVTNSGNEAVVITDINVDLSSSSLDNIIKSGDLYISSSDLRVNSIIDGIDNSNHFPTDIVLAVGMSKTIDVYLNFAHLTGEDIENSIITSMGLTARGINSAQEINNAAVVGQTITVASSSLTIVANGTKPNSTILVAGATTAVSAFTIQATNESYTITNLIVTSTNYNINSDRSIGAVILQYNNEAGSTVTATGYLSDGNVKFNNLSIWVPKGVPTTVTIKAMIADATGAKSGDIVQLNLTPSDGTSAIFTAVSKSTGSAIYDYVGASGVVGNQMVVRKTKPTVSLVALPFTVLADGTQTIARFSISADAVGDVTWKKIGFVVDTSAGVSITDGSIYLYKDGDSTKLNTPGLSMNINGSKTINFVANGEQTINQGTVQTYILRGDVTGSVANSSLATKIFGTSSIAGLSANYAGISSETMFGWSDRSGTADDGVHFSGSDDWCDSNYIQILPSDFQSLTSEAEIGSLASVSFAPSSAITSRYVIGDSIINNASVYNIKANNAPIIIDEMAFQVNSSNADYYPITVLVVNGTNINIIGNYGTSTGMNLTIPNGYAGANVVVKAVMDTVGQNANPSGITTSVSLTYIKYHIAGGSPQTVYYSANQMSGNGLTVVASVPSVSVSKVSNILNAGATNKLVTIHLTADVAGPVNVTQIGLTIATSSNVLVNNFTIKDASGDTQGTVASGPDANGRIIFALANGGYQVPAGCTETLYLYGTVSASSAWGNAGTEYVSTGLADGSDFKWDDINGGLSGVGLTGSLIYGYSMDAVNITN